jgi:hypothetical protein
MFVSMTALILTVSGRNCEHDIDECSNTPELCNNGLCVNSVGRYYSEKQLGQGRSIILIR